MAQGPALCRRVRPTRLRRTLRNTGIMRRQLPGRAAHPLRVRHLRLPTMLRAEEVAAIILPAVVAGAVALTRAEVVVAEADILRAAVVVAGTSDLHIVKPYWVSSV